MAQGKRKKTRLRKTAPHQHVIQALNVNKADNRGRSVRHKSFFAFFTGLSLKHQYQIIDTHLDYYFFHFWWPPHKVWWCPQQIWTRFQHQPCREINKRRIGEPGWIEKSKPQSVYYHVRYRLSLHHREPRTISSRINQIHSKSPDQ